MRESVKEILVDVDIVDPHTGQITPIKAIQKETNRQYNIIGLTTRINSMDMLDIMAAVCRSSKDIDLFKDIIIRADMYNEIRINNISKLALDLGLSRRKLTDMLHRLTEVRPERMLLKLDTGVYMVNPFIMTGYKMRSNAKREEAQEKWNEYMNDSYYI